MSKMKLLTIGGIFCGLVCIGCVNWGRLSVKEGGVLDTICDIVDMEDWESLDDPCEGLSKETTMEEVFPNGLLEVEQYMMDEYPDIDWTDRTEWEDGVKKMWRWHDGAKKKMDAYLKSREGQVAPFDTVDYNRVLKKLEKGFDDYSCCGPLDVAAEGWSVIAHYRLISMYKILISHTQNAALQRAYQEDYRFWARFGLQCVNQWKDEALEGQSYYTMFPVECYGILMDVRNWREKLLLEEDGYLRGKVVPLQAKGTMTFDAISGVAKEWYRYRKKMIAGMNKADAVWFDYMTERIIQQYMGKNFFPAEYGL